MRAGQEELAVALRTGPFGRALRAAISARGLGLQRIQARLAERGVPVGVATLSCWQSGARRPERDASLRAVEALEDILGLPRAALMVLLGPPRPRGPRPDPPPDADRYSEPFTPVSVLDRIVSELETPALGRLRTVSVFAGLYIGPDRSVTRRRTVRVVRAVAEVDRHVDLVQGDAGCDTDLMRVVPLANCRLGRARRDRATGMVATELLFDRVLRVGETHILEYEHHNASGVPCHEFCYGIPLRGTYASLEVRFTSGVVPVRCYRFSRERVDGPDLDYSEIPMAGRDTAHLLATGAVPGLVGLRWDWE
ncbi:hypothetical protein AB0M43_01905 [Longispora sp. NPDC051575]|uniref:hypothetical protein n=1 Tax=Longispora sp. NPDC051575 TaxID=3154943 RepID=UPI003413100E